MVFKPQYPIKDLSDVICGTFMIISATFVLQKIVRGSKNKFSYVLMSLTVLLGTAYVGYAIDDSIRREAILSNGASVYLSNEYALFGLVFLIYVAYL